MCCPDNPRSAVQVFFLSSCERLLYTIVLLIIAAFSVLAYVGFLMVSGELFDGIPTMQLASLQSLTLGSVYNESFNSNDFKTNSVILESKKKNTSLMFMLLSGEGSEETDNLLLPISVIWLSVLTIMFSFCDIYSKFEEDDFKSCDSWVSRSVMSALIVFLEVVVSTFELVVILFRVKNTDFLLIVWPLSNLLRVIDTIIMLLFRSKEGCLSCCYCNYNLVLLSLDIFGTGVGLSMSKEKMWERIVNIFIEIIDAVFALLYFLYLRGVSFVVWVLEAASILKIIALALKIVLSFKGYVMISSNYMMSVWAGIGLAVVFFVCFILMQIRTMGVVFLPFLPAPVYAAPLIFVILCGLFAIAVTGATGVDGKNAKFMHGKMMPCIDQGNGADAVEDGI